MAQQCAQRAVLALVPDLREHTAIELAPRLLRAAHGVAHHGDGGEQHAHADRAVERGSLGVAQRAHRVRRRARHAWLLEHLEHDIAHHLIGNLPVVIDDRLRCKEGDARVARRHAHRKKVRLGDGGGFDAAVELLGRERLVHGLSQKRAVEHLGKHRGEVARGRKILKNRGGAFLHGHNKGRLRRILRLIGELRRGVNAHRRDQRDRRDEIPAPQHVEHRYNGVEGQKLDLLVLRCHFFFRHAQSSTMTRSLVRAVFCP